MTALALLCTGGIVWTARFMLAEPVDSSPQALASSFAQQVKPVLQRNCAPCHNADLMTSGVRVDHLDSSLEERHLKLWEAIRKKVGDGTMPPKGLPQPTGAERQQMVEWITRALEAARSRPTPKNGVVRRLTISQYRNTLRELLLLDDDLTDGLPPDAVSKDGFVNNKETLQLSPLLMEAYFEIAEEALNRCIVDPKSKPAIQNFRVDLGESINPQPFPDWLILGADSLLLDNKDFIVTQVTPRKPFAFEPHPMRTRYRFIEGYEGNDTVRGWREYDSIYHAVFACMRGNHGYPKGSAYSAVPQGLLLRPAIPTDELFGIDGTYGPKANFKISVRELPDRGRFRVTVTAAKYNDGLLLDADDPAQAPASQLTKGSVVTVDHDLETPQSVTIPKAGVYEVDVYARSWPPATPDVSRLSKGLAGIWPGDGDSTVRLEGKARFVDSPFGKAVSLEGDEDSVVASRHDGMKIGDGDFTVAAWIRPRQIRNGGIAGLGAGRGTHGWYLEMPGNKGILWLVTAGPDNKSNGAVFSWPGVIRAEAW